MTAAEIVAAIQQAAQQVAAQTLYEAGIADGCNPLKYADADALQTALAKGRGPALTHALRGVARLYPEQLVESALVLAEDHEGKSELTRAAPFALAHSRDDRALELLLRTMHPALATAAHPATTRRLWDAANASGVLGMRDTLRLLASRADDAALEHARDVLANEHSDYRITQGCGEGLRLSRNPRAAQVIDTHWAHPDSRTALTCVTAALYRDISTAYRRFGEPINATLAGIATPDQQRIVSDLLHAIRGDTSPRVIDPDPLVLEPRFVELAVRLRDHERCAWSARSVIELLPRKQVQEAIDLYMGGRPVGPPALPARELHFGAAAALMKRVSDRHGIGRIATDAELAAITRVVGELPVALEALWRVVGSVDSDELVVSSAADVMNQIEDYADDLGATSPDVAGPLLLDLGGFSLDLPPRNAEDALDPRLYADGPAHRMRLTVYLRTTLV